MNSHRIVSLLVIAALAVVLVLCLHHHRSFPLLREHRNNPRGGPCYVAHLGHGEFGHRMSGRLSLLLLVESHPLVFTYVYWRQEESPEEAEMFKGHLTEKDVQAMTDNRIKWLPLEESTGETNCKKDEIYYTLGATHMATAKHSSSMERIRRFHKEVFEYRPAATNTRPIVVIHAHIGDDDSPLSEAYYLRAVRYHQQRLENPLFIIEMDLRVDMRPVVGEVGEGNVEVLSGMPGDEFDRFLRCMYADGFIGSDTQFSRAVVMLRDPCLPVVVPENHRTYIK